MKDISLHGKGFDREVYGEWLNNKFIIKHWLKGYWVPLMEGSINLFLYMWGLYCFLELLVEGTPLSDLKKQSLFHGSLRIVTELHTQS